MNSYGVYAASYRARDNAMHWWSVRMTLFFRNILGINTINAIPWSIGISICWLTIISAWRMDRIPERARVVIRRIAELLVTLLVFVVALSFVSPQEPGSMWLADVRYLNPMLPVMAAICAGFFWFIHQRSPWIAKLILIMQLSTDLLSHVPGDPDIQPLLSALALEIHRPYPTSISVVSEFLRSKVEPDAIVCITPDFMIKPILYYAGDRVKFRGVLNDDTGISRAIADRLNPQLFKDQCVPQWVVIAGNQDTIAFPNIGSKVSKSKIYRPFGALDVYWGPSQRPELPFHEFGPVRNFDRRTQAVYIFKREIDTPKH